MSLLIPTRAIIAANANYPQGYHRGNAGGLPAVEPDLVAANIKYGETVFGILGTMVQWVYDLSFPELAKLVIPAPSMSQVTVQNSSPPGLTATPSLAMPTPTVSGAGALSYLLVEDCEDAWNEYVQANVVSTADAVDKKVGAASAKLDVGDLAAVGRLATEAIGPLDLTAYRYLKAWVKSSVILASNDLDIMLDEHAACVSPLKELAIPILAADTWTQITLDMGDTSGLGAIISIGIGMNIDKGAFIFHIDQVRATEGL